MRRSTVLVVGSLPYDIMVKADHLPRKDETAVGSLWYPKFGGKDGNQAVAVARAGLQCRMFGRWATMSSATPCVARCGTGAWTMASSRRCRAEARG